MNTNRFIQGLLSSLGRVAWVALLPITDLAARRYPDTGILGVLWLCTLGLALALISATALKEIFQESRKERSWISFSLTMIWLIVVIMMTFIPSLGSGENLLQINCTLKQLFILPTSGLINSCFLGYPSRGYFFQILPTLIFGRSVFSANLGPSLLFLFGIVIFTWGVRTFLRNASNRDFLTGLTLALLMQATVIFRILAYHDQTSNPVALTLLLTGFFLSLVSTGSKLSLFMLSGISVFATSTYPPILSVLALMPFCVLYSWKKGLISTKALLELAIGGIIAGVAFWLSLSFRSDLRMNSNTSEVPDIYRRTLDIILYILSEKDGLAFCGILLRWLLAAVISLCLFGYGGIGAFALAIWILVDIAAAFFLSGYTPFLAWFKMSGIHRAAPVFPIFAILAVVILKERISHYLRTISSQLLSISLILLLSILPFLTSEYLEYSPIAYKVQSVIKAHQNDLSNPPKVVVRMEDWPTGNMRAHLEYFYPFVSIDFIEGGCWPPSINSSALLVVADRPDCKYNLPYPLVSSFYFENKNYNAYLITQ